MGISRLSQFYNYKTKTIFVIDRPEDAERGLEACRGKMFLGAEMDLQYWHGQLAADSYFSKLLFCSDYSFKITEKS